MSFERHLVLQEVMIQPSEEWKPNAQNWVLIRIAEGAGYWLKGESAGELNAGGGLILGSDDQARIRASVLCPMKLEFFTVQPHYLGGLLTVTERHLFKAASKSSPSYFHIFRADDPLGREFARLREETEEDELSARCARLHFWARAVAGILTSESSPSSAGYKSRERFRVLVGQMSETELAASSLQELAEQLHCSKRHFSRLFHEHFGTALRTYQAELRLSRAQQFLAQSNTEIEKVARQCGYRKTSFFINSFKHRFGMSPDRWRHQAQKNALQKPAETS